MTRGELGVYDLKLSRIVEQVKFDGLSLVIPGSENEYMEHSFRVYKGKLFVLVRTNLLTLSILHRWSNLS